MDHTLANSFTDSAFPDSSVGSRARLSLNPSFKSSGKLSAISANDLKAFWTWKVKAEIKNHKLLNMMLMNPLTKK
jgi:hypothetical protein